MSKHSNEIKGIIPPVVTPFTVDYKLDVDAYKRIIQHVIDGGVHGFFILGTNGEGACLNVEIRKEAIKTAVSFNAGRVPVFVNASSPSYLESVELCSMAADEGADYVVLSPPFYFDMNQEELYAFFNKLAGDSQLPVFLYNIPQYTKTEIAPDTISSLALNENIHGLKDSSGDMEYMKQILQEREDPDFKILVGTELLLRECILLGADGGINGGANVFPELFVSMYEASVNGEKERQSRLQEIMKIMGSRVYNQTDSPVSIIIGIKYAMTLRGICSDQMAMPVYKGLEREQKREIEKFIQSFFTQSLI